MWRINGKGFCLRVGGLGVSGAGIDGRGRGGLGRGGRGRSLVRGGRLGGSGVCVGSGGRGGGSALFAVVKQQGTAGNAEKKRESKD